MGTFHNADYVAGLLPGVKSFRAAPQGGWFFPQVGGAPLGGVPLGGGGAPLGWAPRGGVPLGGAPLGGVPLGGVPLGGAARERVGVRRGADHCACALVLSGGH